MLVLLAEWLPLRIEAEDEQWRAELLGQPGDAIAIPFAQLVQLARQHQMASLAIITASLSLAGWLGWPAGPDPRGAALLLFGWALIGLAAVDLRARLLPDALTQPLLWLGLLLQLPEATRGIGLEAALIGAAASYLLLRLPCELYALLTGREAMGGGDYKMTAMIGAWLGLGSAMEVVLLAALVGSGWHVVRLWGTGQMRDHQFSFGPFLALMALFRIITL
jgi:leader peptidase (prepilin peptidase)/N-methyltransferase